MSTLCAQELQLFTIGSGGVSGSYYASARAICEVVNRGERGRLRCSPDPTTGSIYNLRALREAQIDFALVQSDWQRQAFEGKGLFDKKGPMTDLRSVLGLFPEAITVLARADAGIAQLSDLKGKRIDIGHPASGRRATNDRVLRALGLSDGDFVHLAELPVGGAIDEICAGHIDVAILVLGHPNSSVGRALSSCKAVLVPVVEPQIEAALADGADYSRTVIPRSAYPGLATDVPTFAVTATLVTRASADIAIVKTVVSDVLDHLKDLGKSAPVLTSLNGSEMRRQGLTAPLHPGAKAAFDQFDLVQSKAAASEGPLRENSPSEQTIGPR